jgi:hypothetical protein
MSAGEPPAWLKPKASNCHGVDFLKDSRSKNGIRKFHVKIRGDFCHTIHISESGGENAEHSLTICSPADVE